MSKSSMTERDKALFRQAMSEVKPLQKRRVKITRDVSKPDPTYRRRKENLPEPSTKPALSDTISVPVWAETKLSHQNQTMSARQFKQLQLGRIHWQSQIDLHGLRSQEAKSQLLACINQAKQRQQRYILVIHGKGGQNHEPPKLKNLVNVWLKQSAEVLAFHSALPKDGGTGAVYVLLKR